MIVRPGQCTFTVGQLARRWLVKPEAVRALIRAGRLAGFDVAAPGSKRQRFRIALDSIVRFENFGPARPAAKPIRRQRRRPVPERIMFFEE